MKNTTIERNLRRKKRVRAKIIGSNARPRISVYRSNKYIYGQAIDDVKGVTLASFSSVSLKAKQKIKKVEEAKLIGKELGKILKSKKIKTAIFDRNSYEYKGRVKEFCEGIREEGIQI